MARWVSLYKEGHLILEWLADGESHEESDGEDAVKEGEALRPPLRRRDVGDVRVAAQEEHHVAARAVLQALNNLPCFRLDILHKSPEGSG